MHNHTKKKDPSTLKNLLPKTVKRSKSTEQLMSPKMAAKKINPDKIMLNINEESYHQIKSLPKSKSVKSLKMKNNSVTKSDNTRSKDKKQKPKNKNMQKTIKKNTKSKEVRLEEQNSISSFQSTIKKPILQYFFFHNTYIPIENSAQRKLVHKIQLIEKEKQFPSTSQNFYPKKYQHQAAGTQITPTKQAEINTETIQKYQQNIQTQHCKFEESSNKCFSNLLTDLEFLYLPDENNFSNFNRNERRHYSELFQSFAKKIMESSPEVEQLSQEQVQMLLYKRECMQMGMMEFTPTKGFPTHVYSIISYLNNLFSFIEMHCTPHLIACLHTFYGLNYNERVKKLSRGENHSISSSSMLSEEMFMYLEQELFQDYDFGSDLKEKCVHIHNRAVFDAVNEELNIFKPFYHSQGEPFPWSTSTDMTLYDISEQSLPALFNQVKQKMLVNLSYLCGLQIDFWQESEEIEAKDYEIYSQKLELQENKMIKNEIATYNCSPDLEYEYSRNMFLISDSIFEHLLGEIWAEMHSQACPKQYQSQDQSLRQAALVQQHDRQQDQDQEECQDQYQEEYQDQYQYQDQEEEEEDDVESQDQSENIYESDQESVLACKETNDNHSPFQFYS